MIRSVGSIGAVAVVFDELGIDDDATLREWIIINSSISSSSSSSLLLLPFVCSPQPVVAPPSVGVTRTERFVDGVNRPPAPNWNKENISYDSNAEGDNDDGEDNELDAVMEGNGPVKAVEIINEGL